MYMAASLDAVNDVRGRLGLAAVARLGDLVDRAAVAMVTCPRELDAPAADLGPNVRYVGPVLEPTEGGSFGVVDQPEVVVSMGTTDMDETAVLERVLAALADLPVSVLATVGDHLDPAAVNAPANAVVARYVPHGSILPKARLLVCHAGLGGVLAALTHGVPILCLPLGRDQPANAAQVDRTGVGRALSPDASVADIRDAASALLAGGCTSMAEAVAAYGDAPVVTVESLLAG
jgi:MGT family glycosyltransferase